MNYSACCWLKWLFVLASFQWWILHCSFGAVLINLLSWFAFLFDLQLEATDSRIWSTVSTAQLIRIDCLKFTAKFSSKQISISMPNPHVNTGLINQSAWPWICKNLHCRENKKTKQNNLKEFYFGPSSNCIDWLWNDRKMIPLLNVWAGCRRLCDASTVRIQAVGALLVATFLLNFELFLNRHRTRRMPIQ